jgi:hypothetical protein
MVSAIVALVVLVAARVGFAAVDPALVCGRDKTHAVEIMAQSQLACQSDAVLAGDSVDGFCLNDASVALVAAFAAADGAGGCTTTNDGFGFSGRVQQFTGAIASSLRSGLDPSRCAATRMAAAGRYVRRALHHEARARVRGGDGLPGGARHVRLTSASRLRTRGAIRRLPDTHHGRGHPRHRGRFHPPGAGSSLPAVR